jgi:hypothetical protein
MKKINPAKNFMLPPFSAGGSLNQRKSSDRVPRALAHETNS